MCLRLLLDSVTCSFMFRRQGTVPVGEDTACSGVPLSSWLPCPGASPCCTLAEGVRAMLGCDPEGDIQGRSTHKLWENSAMKVFCKAAVLLGRSLIDLQLTLVWGGQQECLKGRKPSDRTCRSCPTLANPSVAYPCVPKDMPMFQPGCSVLAAQWDWSTLVCNPGSLLGC